MEHFVLQAFAREKTTKGGLNASRREGKIPAVLYGGGKSARNLFVFEQEYEKALKNITESTIITLDVQGTKIQAFVKEHQREAVSKDLLHIDFLEVQAGKKLHAHVRIHLNGIPVGVKLGGILENPAHDIEVECDPSVLPERIEVDVSQLEANHSIHVRDLPEIQGVKVLSSPDMVVAIVKFARQEAEPAAEAAVEAAPADAAAATTPAAGPEANA